MPISMGINPTVMPKPTTDTPQRKRGRPPTGKTKIKLSASASPALIATATKHAYKRGESFSSYVCRAIQTQILNEQ